MLPASLYTPLFFQAMLLVVIACSLVYCGMERSQIKHLAQFNQFAGLIVGIAVTVFIGLRPVSGVFVDMPLYARSFERVQQGGEGSFSDPLFGALVRLCGYVLPVGGFFFVCTLIYVASLASASWRTHGQWGFPVLLAFLTAFSFWAYAVNGIRNGMATSVLILAFAFYDKPVVMLALMVAAWGLHGSVLLPAAAFIVVRYVRQTSLWLLFWVACVALSLFAGNVSQRFLRSYNPFAYDDRVETYLLGPEGSGFRADFLAYSILPVLVVVLLAAPGRAPGRRVVARVMTRPPMNWVRNRGTIRAIGMRLGRPLFFQAAERAMGLAFATSAPRSQEPRSSAEDTRHALGGCVLSPPSARPKQNAWDRLPWVRFLRMDSFYARLVNTYLLANAIWVLLIHANFSNRFAYLSWFMMPWLLLYPFVPGKIIDRPRSGLIAVVLFVHYLFTYFMWMVFYRMSF